MVGQILSGASSLPRVLVITPCPSGGLPTQGAALADHLRLAGFRTTLISRAQSSWGRLLDIAVRGSILAFWHDAVIISVYGRRGFVYESVAILAARWWRKRSIAFLHSGGMPAFVQQWRRWSKWILPLPDVVLVPHGFLAEALTKLGLRVDGILPNFIDLTRFPFRERAVLAPRFLYLRGMHSYYNPEMAIQALAVIQQRYPDACLTMVGSEGQHSVLCRDLVRTLQVRHVHFMGRVPQEEIPRLAAQHDIHLHTNRIDNMPVSIIEMWACGLPIVGTSVGGMPYLIRDHQDGLLVPSEDYQAMAKTCLELLANAELANTLSRNGRARAEALTWERVQPLWINLLLDLEHTPPAPQPTPAEQE
jgi:glycosyltransferase involved in cell wall biosynthesis